MTARGPHAVETMRVVHSSYSFIHFLFRRCLILFVPLFLLYTMPREGALAASEAPGVGGTTTGAPSSPIGSFSSSVSSFPGAPSGGGAQSGEGIEGDKQSGAVCFHVRDLECYEPPTPKSDADPDVDATDLRCSTICVSVAPHVPRSPIWGPQGGGGQRAGPTTTHEAPPSLSRTSSASSVSAARRRFYLSSPSGSEWQLQIKESQEIQRFKLLQEERVIRALSRAALLGWRLYPESAIDVEKISGGLSNQLYLITLNTEDYSPLGLSPKGAHTSGGPAGSLRLGFRGGTLNALQGASQEAPEGEVGGVCTGNGPLVKKALVRVYGHQQGTALFDVRTERKLFKALGKLNVAPKCLAEFEVRRHRKETPEKGCCCCLGTPSLFLGFALFMECLSNCS